MNEAGDSPLGLLSFLSFAISIIAAVLAIDMYKLLRTGEFGKTWRVLITASVMLALLQVLRMAEILNYRALDQARLAQIVELCFVLTLAYAFYCQRKVFSRENPAKPHAHSSDRMSDAEEGLHDEPEQHTGGDDFEGAAPAAQDSEQSHFFSAGYSPREQ